MPGTCTTLFSWLLLLNYLHFNRGKQVFWSRNRFFSEGLKAVCLDNRDFYEGLNAVLL